MASASRINRGQRPDLVRAKCGSDFHVVPANDPEQAGAGVMEPLRTCILRCFVVDPICGIQAFCPMNRDGVRARSLNIALQTALNRAGYRKVERFGSVLAVGGKVM